MCGNTSYLNGSLRGIVLPYCPTLCTSHVGGSAFGAVCRLTRLCSFWIGKVQVQQQDLCSSHVFIRKKQKKKVQSLGIQLGGGCLYPKICFFFYCCFDSKKPKDNFSMYLYNIFLGSGLRSWNSLSLPLTIFFWVFKLLKRVCLDIYFFSFGFPLKGFKRHLLGRSFYILIKNDIRVRYRRCSSSLDLEGGGL